MLTVCWRILNLCQYIFIEAVTVQNLIKLRDKGFLFLYENIVCFSLSTVGESIQRIKDLVVGLLRSFSKGSSKKLNLSNSHPHTHWWVKNVSSLQ